MNDYKSGDKVYAILKDITGDLERSVMFGVLNPRLKPGSKPISFAPFMPGTKTPNPDIGWHISQVEIFATYHEAANEYAEKANRIIGALSRNMIGYALDMGLIEGIERGESEVINRVIRMVQNAINAANAAAGIHSPSRIFEDSKYVSK